MCVYIYTEVRVTTSGIPQGTDLNLYICIYVYRYIHVYIIYMYIYIYIYVYMYVCYVCNRVRNERPHYWIPQRTALYIYK